MRFIYFSVCGEWINCDSRTMCTNRYFTIRMQSVDASSITIFINFYRTFFATGSLRTMANPPVTYGFPWQWTSNAAPWFLCCLSQQDFLPVGNFTRLHAHVTSPKLIHNAHHWPVYHIHTHARTHKYEVRDLFPWEMLTRIVIPYLLNFETMWNSAQINLSSTLNFYRKYFWRNDIHRDVEHWNRRRFGAQWNVTLPNPVTPITWTPDILP